MIRTLPQVKELRTGEGGAWELPHESQGAGLRVELRMELPDERILRQAHRLFAGGTIECESAGPNGGYRMTVGSGTDEVADELASSVPDRPEAYTLKLESGGAVIYAADAAGLYYGMMTLAQLLDQPEQLRVGLEIRDWPDTAQRWMHLDFRQTFSRFERLLEYIEQMAQYKVNGLLIEYEDKFPFEAYAHLKHPEYALSGDQLELLKQTAHEHFIEIIPLQQTFGHLEYVLRHDEYKGLRETEASTGEICPSHPEAYALIAGMLDEVIAGHPEARYIHLGCDEVYSLCECEVCRERYEGSRERTFIDFLNRMIALCVQRGKKPIFWHDMLDKCPDEELHKLDPRAAVMIWLYNGRNIVHDVSTLTAKFRRYGIEVMGAPAVRCWDQKDDQNYPNVVNRLDNVDQWIDALDSCGIDGLVGTNWTGAFSLGVPYGIFETTWYTMLYAADRCWNRGSSRSPQAVPEPFIDRFLALFHGVEPETARRRIGRFIDEDYYSIVWRLVDEVKRHREVADWQLLMREYEIAVDHSRAIHKYVYRWELYQGDEAEWRSLQNNYRRTTGILRRIRPEMLAQLERFQPASAAAHYVLSRYYVHDVLEERLYREIGLSEPL